MEREMKKKIPANIFFSKYTGLTDWGSFYTTIWYIIIKKTHCYNYDWAKVHCE